MRRFPPALAVLLLCVASSPALAAWSTSPSVNLPVRVAVNITNFPFVISDGAGGALVAWTDSRNQGTTGDDVYAAHILKTGMMDPAWPANGLVVCNAAGNQELNTIISDGVGGMIIAWDDARGATKDIYAQRINSNGTFPAGWTTVNGKLIGAAAPLSIARDDFSPVACTDGAGGAIIAWTVTYTPSTDTDIYANHVLANGNIAGGWQATGSVIDAPSGLQDSPVISEDGLGGAYIVFRDTYENSNPQILYRTVTGAGVVSVPSPDAVIYTNIDQEGPVGASDGLGGMFVAWRDARTVPHRITINDITPVGVNGTPFANSISLLGQTTDYDFPLQILPDGNGGAYVTWSTSASMHPEFISHVNGNALVANGWSANGVSAGKSDDHFAMVPDGTGGVDLAYSDNYDIYGIHFNGDGSLPPGWGYSTFISNAPNYQYSPAVCTDGLNGMIAVWSDNRDNYRGMNGIYAQRIDRFGALGDASPSSAGIKDVPNDQGGHVRVSWNPSYLDAYPTNGINNYFVYRQLPTHMAVQQVKAGRMKVAADESAAHDAKTLRVTRDAAQTYYWEQIASVSAMQLPGYSLDASTASDSVPGSNPYTLFMIEAMAYSGAYWMSAPDSGYSKDNLPPLPPAPVSAAYSPGGTSFHWAPNTESDLANYRIYRGVGLSFVPGPGNLVASPTDTTYFDATSSTYIYKMSAVDIHGNESGFTTITPSGVLDAGIVPHELAFVIASQNPGPGSMTFSLTLPSESSVRIALYDTMGRRVRMLANGHQPAGEQTLRWDGSDESGHAAASGLYFARFDCLGRSIVRRFVIER